jgi:hypothetical protein
MRMRSNLFLTTVILLILPLWGCSHGNKGQATPYTQAQLDQIRADFQAQDPDARVGVVTGVVAGSNLAAVGDVRVRDFQRDDVITFIDQHGNILTSGHVEGANSGGLLVRFAPPAHGRNPDIGDLAVRAVK